MPGQDDLRAHIIDPEPGFQRGDTNFDRRVDISDPVATLSWLFTGGAAPNCADAADSNDSGMVDISDAVFTLAFLFTGGSEPPTPGPHGCGEDPTEDELSACHPCAREGAC